MFYWLFNNVCTSKGAAPTLPSSLTLEPTWSRGFRASVRCYAGSAERYKKEDINPQVTWSRAPLCERPVQKDYSRLDLCDKRPL